MPTGDYSGSLQRWWEGQSDEIFWLESTDRPDIGRDLHAPEANDSGALDWRYGLLREIEPGDVVLHYAKQERGIVAWSRAVGLPWRARVTWGARGTYARSKGTVPYDRDGWVYSLEGPVYLDQPVTLSELETQKTALAELATKFKYFPFETAARPTRPLQGYVFKVPRELVMLIGLLSSVPLSRGEAARVTSGSATAIEMRSFAAGPSSVGRPYSSASETSSVAPSDPWARDPGEVDRALIAHATLQNEIAEHARTAGYEVLSPAAGEPLFDLLCRSHEGSYVVAEVKSITPSNEERQLRLAVGQVLRYRDLLARRIDAPIVPLVIVEHKPSDPSWLTLLASLKIQAAWPDIFADVFTPQP